MLLEAQSRLAGSQRVSPALLDATVTSSPWWKFIHRVDMGQALAELRRREEGESELIQAIDRQIRLRKASSATWECTRRA